MAHFGRRILMSLVWHKLVLEGLIPPHRQHESTQSSNPKIGYAGLPNLATIDNLCLLLLCNERLERYEHLNELEESSKSLHYFPQLCLYKFTLHKIFINKHLPTTSPRLELNTNKEDVKRNRDGQFL
ncbi:hypothetical protein ACJX0J_040132 [Zea mays]